MVENLHLKTPSVIKKMLERAGVEITPVDICSRREELNKLYKMYPDLAGDGTAIGPGDDGNCQSWRNNPGWWKTLLDQHSKRLR